MLKSLSVRVVIALALGIGLGAWARTLGDPRVAPTVEAIEAFGGLWLNALRMTVVPLVFALVVVGIASAASAVATGRLAARAMGVFAVLIVFAGLYTTAATEALLTLFPVNREAAAAFIAGAGGEDAPAAQELGFGAWLLMLAPANAIRAAAEEAMLGLVVFAMFFGFAATQIDARGRDALVGFFRAVADTMVVIVRWVLIAAPLGVFALSLGVGLRAGLGAASVLAHYVLVVSSVTAFSCVIAYAIALVFGRVPLTRFAPATAPVLAVAFSTQSSLASLPAMLEAARNLGVAERVRDLVLPLAVAVFRFTSPIANLAVAYFILHLYGIELSLPLVAAGIVVAIAISIGTVGLPGQVSFFSSMAPICLALGAPTGLLGIFHAVEVIPDIFRTLGNVLGHLAATLIARRGEKEEEPAAVEGATR